jgi:hypothetical protein
MVIPHRKVPVPEGSVPQLVTSIHQELARHVGTRDSRQETLSLADMPKAGRSNGVPYDARQGPAEPRAKSHVILATEMTRTSSSWWIFDTNVKVLYSTAKADLASPKECLLPY